jgi:hypothetical protein
MTLFETSPSRHAMREFHLSAFRAIGFMDKISGFPEGQTPA